MAIFVAIALTLTALTFWFNKMFIGMAASAGWLLVGIYAFVLSTSTWDINYGLGFMGLGIAIAMALETLALREKDDTLAEDYEEEDEETELYIQARIKYEAQMDDASDIMGDKRRLRKLAKRREGKRRDAGWPDGPRVRR